MVREFHPRLAVACSFQKEASVVLDLILRAYDDLGLRPSRFLLSLPADDARIGVAGSKYVGDQDSWDRSAAVLKAVLGEAGGGWPGPPAWGRRRPPPPRSRSTVRVPGRRRTIRCPIR